MFPVQISVFISEVQVHLDPQEINVSKYNRSMERRRGESSQWQWKPEPLQNTAGLCWGAGVTQQLYLSLKDRLGRRIWPLIQQGLCTTLTLQSLSDRFACCCQRDGESFSVPALHFPLLSQLHITTLSTKGHKSQHLKSLNGFVLSFPLSRGSPDSEDDVETLQPQEVTCTHSTNTHVTLPCRRMFQERDNRGILLSCKHSTCVTSSTVTSHSAKILSARKYYSSLSAHSSDFFKTTTTTTKKMHFDSLFQSCTNS